MPLPKLLATCALAVLVASVALVVMAFDESRHEREERVGLTKIPSDSEFVRSLLDARVSDELVDVNTTVWYLRAANRFDDAEALKRFFVDCNVQRMLVADDACRRDTVGAAIDKGRVLAVTSDRSAAPVNLEATLARALSFRLPDEQALLASIAEQSRRNVRYDGPGVLRHADRDGGYVFVSARNDTSWPIAGFASRLTVAPPGAPAVELECKGNNPWPFYTRVLAPMEEVVAYCRPPDDVPFEQVVAGIRGIPADSLEVRVAQLDLNGPYVRVVDGGERAALFALEPLVRLFIEGRDFAIMEREGRLPRELAAMDCEKLDTCRFALPAFVFRWLDELHPLVLPPFFGVLLGVIIGGFARRSLSIGGAFIAFLATVTAIGIAALITTAGRGADPGFVLMGAAALIFGAIVAFAVGVPAFLIALLLVRALHPQPSSVMNPPS